MVSAATRSFTNLGVGGTAMFVQMAPRTSEPTKTIRGLIDAPGSAAAASTARSTVNLTSASRRQGAPERAPGRIVLRQQREPRYRDAAMFWRVDQATQRARELAFAGVIAIGSGAA